MSVAISGAKLIAGANPAYRCAHAGDLLLICEVRPATTSSAHDMVDDDAFTVVTFQ
jgi:hypothetical protein